MDLFKSIQKSIAVPSESDTVPRFLIIKSIIERILAIEGLEMNGTYLDIGCDRGDASIFLSHNFFERVNLDISKININKCKLNCSMRGVEAHFIVADATRLPFKNTSFKVISAFSLIEHLKDHPAFMTEINRILMKEGICTLQFPNGNFLIELHSGIPLPALTPRKVVNIYFKYLLHGTDEFPIWNLTKKEIIKICEPIFGRVCIEKCNYDEHSIPIKARLIYRIFKMMKFLNVCPLGWVVVCEKKR